MKRNVLLLFSFLINLQLTAQDPAEYRNEFAIIPAAGFNVSRIYVNQDAEDFVGPSSFKMRPDLGVSVNIPLQKGLSFRPGVHYRVRAGALNEPNDVFIQQSLSEIQELEGQFGQDGGFGFARAITQISDIDVSGKYVLHYVHFPLEFVYSITTGANSSLQIFGGPYAALALKGNAEVEADVDAGGFFQNTFREEIEFDFENDFKEFDYGFTVGGGFEIHRFLFTARYGMGLVEANQEDAEIFIPVPEGFSARNQFFEFGIGYMIGF